MTPATHHTSTLPLAGPPHVLDAARETPDRLSRLAGWTASVCAVHCVVTPVAAALFPLMGFGVFATPAFEWSMVAIAAVLGGAGFALTPRCAHTGSRARAFFVAGIAVLSFAHLALEPYVALHGATVVAGALLILVAGRTHHVCAPRSA